MGNSFIVTLLNTLKSKITPLVTKLRFYLSIQFWRATVFTKFREMFSRIFNVRPKDKDDYYGIWRYLVSKRLAYAIVLAIGVVSAVYIVAIRGMIFPQNGAIKSYKYSSVMLRFANSDKVIIKGRSGYKAYEGAVTKGKVSGIGKLYDKEGNLVYSGEFENNRYNGVGTAYYESGTTKYNGQFVENLYEGEGKLYRDNGSLYYSGAFSHGLKNGTGTLYDNGGNDVYTGEFVKDQLSYISFIGKSAPDVSEGYNGNWVTYESKDEYCVYLKDIDAIYTGSPAEDSVEDEITVQSVYVLKDAFLDGKEKYDTIPKLKEYFGKPLYEGNSYAILPEAVSIYELAGKNNAFKKSIGFDFVRKYNEYSEVESYDDEYILYLYTFEKDGLLYTFYTDRKDSGFGFYSIMEATDDDEVPTEEEE